MGWNDDMHGGFSSAGWVLMLLALTVFVGVLVWAVVALTRRGPFGPPAAPPPAGHHDHPVPHSHDQRPDAEAILRERLARGEIDVADYRARLEALHHQPA